MNSNPQIGRSLARYVITIAISGAAFTLISVLAARQALAQTPDVREAALPAAKNVWAKGDTFPNLPQRESISLEPGGAAHES